MLLEARITLLKLASRLDAIYAEASTSQALLWAGCYRWSRQSPCSAMIMPHPTRLPGSYFTTSPRLFIELWHREMGGRPSPVMAKLGQSNVSVRRKCPRLQGPSPETLFCAFGAITGNASFHLLGQSLARLRVVEQRDAA